MSRMSGEPSNPALPTCGSCGSHLVHPTGGRQADRAGWEVEFRCPDCDGRELSYYTEAELEQLDREQDRATSEIEAELSRMEREHMGEWVARFVHALELDLIGPDDF
jgi:ribosomal protein S27E